MPISKPAARRILLLALGVGVARRLPGPRRIALATEPQLQGWPAWNLTRERARAALAGWVPAGR